jgi:hypothetical protein
MALLSIIRRWHFREHLSIRAIARRVGSGPDPGFAAPACAAPPR